MNTPVTLVVPDSIKERVSITPIDPQHAPAFLTGPYARLIPYAFRMKAHDVQQTITTVALRWSIIGQDSKEMQIRPRYYSPVSGMSVVKKNGSTTFWVGGGRMSDDVFESGHFPLMHAPSDKEFEALEKAQFVSVSIDLIGFADGTFIGPDELHTIALMQDARHQAKFKRFAEKHNRNHPGVEGI